jgi:transcriptional regulator GlxA family with amidase domain
MCQPACKKLNREPDGRRDVFSQQVGTTPARFVARLRLQAAKERLEATADNVEAIASRAGFGDGEALRCMVRKAEAGSPSAACTTTQMPVVRFGITARDNR